MCVCVVAVEVYLCMDFFISMYLYLSETIYSRHLCRKRAILKLNH